MQASGLQVRDAHLSLQYLNTCHAARDTALSASERNLFKQVEVPLLKHRTQLVQVAVHVPQCLQNNAMTS